MENLYKKFFKDLYLKTGGFLATKPINQSMYPGDFFQIKNGETVVLGNIYRESIIDPNEHGIEYGFQLNPANWSFSNGVTKPYSGRGTGNNPLDGEFEFSKQILAFDAPGSFMFKADNVLAAKIANWDEIKVELLIKLALTHYSFREVYVVTSCASDLNWSLAIASSDKAELEIATGEENSGLVDIFGASSVKVVQSRDIHAYHRETDGKPSFFKAKKLGVKDDGQGAFINELILKRGGHNDWASNFYAFDFDSFTQSIPSNSHMNAVNALDMLQTNDLNPNTVQNYLDWKDANLDDVEKLFSTLY